MVKASAGGGGRGMRIVRERAELKAALRSASVEAESAFGDGRLILERALVGARHVEIQVFGDEFGAIVHLGERDCSIQRRHQKVIEEAPSPAVSCELRASMGAAAVKAAAAVGYVGAGTVEFLLVDDGRFYFLEMNTRIQVEHPVTECVTGIDLVRLQFQVAQGRPLPFAQSDVALRGHAIEARLYAEDPAAGFPAVDRTLVAWRPGGGDGVRIDSGVEVGSAVTPFYDSMLAKIIAFGAYREEALRRLVKALERTFVAGVRPTATFFSQRCGGRTSSKAERRPLSSPTRRRQNRGRTARRSRSRRCCWSIAAATAPTAGWRASPLPLAVDGVEWSAFVRRQGENWIVTIDGEVLTLRLVSRDEAEIRVSVDGVVVRASYARRRRSVARLRRQCRRIVDRTYAPPLRQAEDADGAVRSPVTGVVVGVEATPGDRVRRGQALATVEAMKMQYSILAPIDGVIAEANAVPGRQAQARALLFAIAPDGE